MHQQFRWTATPSRLIGAPTSTILTIFTSDALPGTTLPINPGLGQAPNMLACIPSGLVHTQWPAYCDTATIMKYKCLERPVRITILALPHLISSYLAWPDLISSDPSDWPIRTRLNEVRPDELRRDEVMLNLWPEPGLRSSCYVLVRAPLTQPADTR